MRSTNENLEDGRVAEEAARWFACLQGEAATGDDWLAFEHWLQAAPENALAYERLEGLWIDLEFAPVAKDLVGRFEIELDRAGARRVAARRRCVAG